MPALPQGVATATAAPHAPWYVVPANNKWFARLVVVEAMIEAGVLLGMPRTTSTELVVQTLYGAATMLKETGLHPTVLREQVSSPGGTTMAALRQLDDHKVRAAFVTAIEAAAERSKQLASGSG